MTTEITTPSSRSAQWPFNVASSTGAENSTLLHALLAAERIDELSDAENHTAVERYLNSEGKVDERGRTTAGVMFWLYPTGLKGPYHVTDEGKTEQHGTLITVESGVLVEETMRKLKEVKVDGIAHEHIGVA
ncbi:uncharacterized protein STEHIDRAFT_144288 [Stereum hirsutum FP-91666 SS1]|uniref:uncharacterized protein n=1 Tax=Stereum hirsutum (strain FP-91666) TaxID=721885 RepID=UPI000440CA87|nr:uncharacterized protein STEHIDRAFT_144288 [Stereum hirsutum FP-91666 SS1]EIM90717.1 hypothetical protein STEHIDRAFT_144288 [Stereum hirsutum FP-91666 SS1]